MNHELRIPIVILHGWGLRASAYNPLVTFLIQKGYNVHAFDLPGFGDESLISPNMRLDDYVEFVHRFLRQHKIERPIIIGHSFGGRIAIKLAYKYPSEVEKLILTGVPIIRNKSLLKRTQFFAAEIGGKFFKFFPLKTQEFMRKVLYKLIGEWDYYNAGNLKQVFKNVVGEELTEYIKNLKVKVVLAWGEEDQRVAVSDIVKIKTLMKNAQVVIIPKVGHTPMRDHPSEYFKAIKPFL